MSSSPSHDVTRLLQAWSHGDQEALARLMPLVYEELHLLARHYMDLERPDHTLQPTALIHEAYCRLVGQNRVRWENRTHFYGVAALVMRRVLLQYARRQRAAKRDHDNAFALLTAPSPEIAAGQAEDLIAIDEAVSRLEAVDAQQSRIVELRFFGGLTIEETADVLSVSTATVKREWRVARAWLQRQLAPRREPARDR